MSSIAAAVISQAPESARDSCTYMGGLALELAQEKTGTYCEEARLADIPSLLLKKGMFIHITIMYEELSYLNHCLVFFVGEDQVSVIQSFLGRYQYQSKDMDRDIIIHLLNGVCTNDQESYLELFLSLDQSKDKLDVSALKTTTKKSMYIYKLEDVHFD